MFRPTGKSVRIATASLLVALTATACSDLDTSPVSPLSPSDSAAFAKKPHAERVSFWLTLLHNNDGESALINAGVGREDFGGVARFATLVDQLRNDGRFPVVTGKPGAMESENFPDGWEDHKGRALRGSILVSSGDNFLAGPAFNASLRDGTFYDAVALDLIGYDALVIGNHEFDFGPDILADFISAFTGDCPRGNGGKPRLCDRSRKAAPFVSANLDFGGEPELAELVRRKRIAASVVVVERGQRIGIIGATTTMLPFISSPRNVVVSAVASAVQEEVRRLERVGVNKIILISHLQSVAEDLALIPLLRGVDIVVAGGGDDLLANAGTLLIPGDAAAGSYPSYAADSDGKQVPVITTSGAYRYVGKLVAGFDKRGNIVAIDNSASGPVRVAGGSNPDAVLPHPLIQQLVVEPVAQSLVEQGANVIANSNVPLDGRRPFVRTVETNQGNLIADALLWEARERAAAFALPLPQIALQNSGGIRNDAVVPAGPLTELFTFDALPFLNFLAVVPNVPRAQLREILENVVSRVEFTDGRFAQISGFAFEWNPAGTAQTVDALGNVVTPGSRVREVVLSDGTIIVANGAVVAGAPISVAVADFLARGGDQYPFRGLPFTTVGVTYQQALFNYLIDGLGGVVSAAQYPAGGSSRITRTPPAP